MASRKVKKLLFFARPELHAERNLFELGLIALRRATATGAFPRDRWVINGLGCPRFPDLDLEFGQKLIFLGKLPLAEYVAQLGQHDVGLCLMFAPHPSVPNFEMAAAGMPTVTTAFVNRTREQMEQICPNFVAPEASIDSIVQALLLAEHRSFDFAARRRNASFAWPRSWDQTFCGEWMAEFFRALDAELGHARLVRLFPTLDLQRPVPDATAAPHAHTPTATALRARKGSY
jgi:hypothetical protein